MAYNPIVVTLSSLKPFFFNGLKKELCFLDNAWSIRPRNPIRTTKIVLPARSKADGFAEGTSLTQAIISPFRLHPLSEGTPSEWDHALPRRLVRANPIRPCGSTTRCQATKARAPALARITLAAARPASGRGPHTGWCARAPLRDKTAACAASGQRTPDTRPQHSAGRPLVR